MSEQSPEWLSLDDGESVQWVGEPELASKAGELLTGIALLPLLGLGLLVLLPAYLQVSHTDYVVTNQSLYAKSGILSTNIQSLDLDKIQNTEYSQSFFEKQLGYGTVGVDTAGGSDVELEFEAIADAREVQESIRELSKRYREAAAGGEPSETPRAGTGDLDAVADELERTAEALENVEAAISQALSARRAGRNQGGQSSPASREQEAAASHETGTEAEQAASHETDQGDGSSSERSSGDASTAEDDADEQSDEVGRLWSEADDSSRD